jgi:RNA polymerase sigma-70 factor, ECF subfamily
MREKLLERILIDKVLLHKDADAFAELYDRYVDSLYRFILLKVPRKEDAEDIASTVFLKAWDFLIRSDVSRVRHVQAFFYTMARNAVADWYRNRGSTLVVPVEEAELLAAPVGGSGDTLSIDTFHAVRQLKQEYQDIVLLRYVEGYSLLEVARIVGKQPIAVRVTLHRALKKLETLL